MVFLENKPVRKIRLLQTAVINGVTYHCGSEFMFDAMLLKYLLDSNIDHLVMRDVLPQPPGIKR